MTNTAIFRSENTLMPLKLKAVMQARGVTYRELCPRVMQMSGKPISVPALNLLLNWGTWPAKTPEHSIKEQVEAVLREHGATQDELAVIWHQDRPIVGHTNRMKVTRDAAMARTERLEQLERLEAEMLTKEARSHFDVQTSPFTNDVNGEEDIFVTKELRSAYNALYYTMKHAGITALVCESGGGKTVLRRWLDNTIRERQEPIRILSPIAHDKRILTSGQICEALIRDLAPETVVPGSLERRARRLQEILDASKAAGNSNVLLIEEAHDLNTMMFKHLKRFWEMEKGFTKLLGIVLIGQPELKRKLDARANFDAREFINRCEVYELPPLGPDLEAYLEFKFKRVGINANRVLGKDACDGIRARLAVPAAGGRIETLLYPLYVNNLVTKAMNLCARIGAPKVTAEVIQKL